MGWLFRVKTYPLRERKLINQFAKKLQIDLFLDNFVRIKTKQKMETLILEVSETEKILFLELATRLKTKYELVKNFNQLEEDRGLYNAILFGKKEGRMSENEQTAFLEKIGR